MARNSRDEFSESTKRQLSERVAYMCSNPLCRRLTVKRRGGEIDRNRAEYPAEKLRHWKEDAELYVETLHTQDSRLRQLRAMATELLSTIRLLTAIPGPEASLDQTFRTAGLIPVSRLLIEVEQTLFENDFQPEADQVRSLQQDILQVEVLMHKKPTNACLDISTWKNRVVQDVMTKIMRFSQESYDHYLSKERSMVSDRLRQLQNHQVVTCTTDLEINGR